MSSAPELVLECLIHQLWCLCGSERKSSFKQLFCDQLLMNAMGIAAFVNKQKLARLCLLSPPPQSPCTTARWAGRTAASARAPTWPTDVCGVLSRRPACTRSCAILSSRAAMILTTPSAPTPRSPTWVVVVFVLNSQQSIKGLRLSGAAFARWIIVLLWARCECASPGTSQADLQPSQTGSILFIWAHCHCFAVVTKSSGNCWCQSAEGDSSVGESGQSLLSSGIHWFLYFVPPSGTF